MLTIILPNRNEKNVDNTVTELTELFPEAQIIVSDDPNGRGKGWAIRQGLELAEWNHIAFLDADGDIKPEMLMRLLPFCNDFDAVVGTKRINHKRFGRRVLTFLSRFYIRLLFGVHVDTQTGIKIFKRSALKPWKSDGFIFDVEILSQIKGKSVVEIPVDAVITSSMSGGSVWRTLKESLMLKLRLLSQRK